MVANNLQISIPQESTVHSPASPTEQPEPSDAAKLCENIKLVVSTCVVMTLITVVFTGISLNYCVLQLHPAINFVLLFCALTLLAYIEAQHYAIVCIEKWDMSQYEHSYPRVFKISKIVDSRQKVKKFLVGRQFFVIFVVFLIAQITSFPHIPKDFAGLPSLFITILFQTGLPGVALVLTFGQLVSQIYVEEFTIQFLNLYGNEFVVRLCLSAEWIGVCNFSWLLFHIFSRLTCRAVIEAQRTMNSSDVIEEGADARIPRSPTQLNRDPDFVSSLVVEEPLNWFDYLKYIWSTCATLGAIFIVGAGIYQGYYVLPTPVIATYVVFVLALIMLFYLEGLMISIVATQYWNKETWKLAYPRAYMLHEIINRPDNVKRFIIGRQFCTVLVSFLIAQVSTFADWPADGYNPILFFIIVKSGLVGVLIVLSFGQLLPELLGQEYPLRFMDMRGSYSVGYISLVGDACGVGHCAWAFYFITRKIFCRAHYEAEKSSPEKMKREEKVISKVHSAELLVKTGSPLGHTLDERV